MNKLVKTKPNNKINNKFNKTIHQLMKWKIFIKFKKTKRKLLMTNN